MDQTPPPATSQSLFNNHVDETHEDQSEDHDDEFNQLNLLTQYIGGPSSSETTIHRREPSPVGDEELKKAELAKLKQNYLEQTDLIDRGESHLNTLDRVIESISLNHVIVGVNTKVLFGRWFNLLSPLST